VRHSGDVLDEKEVEMHRRSIAAMMLAALVGAACTHSGGGGPATHAGASAVTTPGASGYHPVIDPDDFTGLVDNPWVPLKPGTTFIYTGTKDGEPSRDVYVVSHDTVTIDGVPCVVVNDQLYLSGKLEEKTTDYYTQDTHGNVWYFGEATEELDKQGNVTSTEGSWLAGKDGALPGIFMEANPVVGHAYRQEYYPGHAEDQFKVVSVAASVQVPYGSFTGTLLTQEWTALEPAVLDHKYYVRGVGEVSETSVKGPKEEALLVSVTTG
jgi:hypothetical protein